MILIPDVMKKKKLILISAVVLVLGAIVGTAVHSLVTAQDVGQGLQVSPPSQEATIDPGGTTTVKAKIRNPGNTVLPIQVHIEDFTAKGDEGEVELTANSPYSIASWTKVSPKTFQLAPGEEQEVTATITAPKNAAGGHFGSFIFGVTSDTPGKNTATVAQEIASLFLVKVNGPVNENLSIDSLTAPQYSEFGPVPFAMRFKNSGNVYVKTFGLVNVTDMFGHKTADIVVKGTNVFPGAERVITASLDKPWLIGRYTATALMYYGSQQTQNISATTTFYVFPTRIVIILLAILILLFLLRKRLKKAFVVLFGK